MKQILFALAITLPLGMAPVAFGQQTTRPPDAIQGHLSHGDSAHVDSADQDKPVRKATPTKGTANSNKSTASADKTHRKSTAKHGRKTTAKSKHQVPAKKSATPAASSTTTSSTPK